MATYDYIAGNSGLWSKAYCDNCYTSPLHHSSQLTETTTEFFALADTVLDCFGLHPNTSKLLGPDTSDACSACGADYRALNKFYRQRIFQTHFPKQRGICFDILDTMNSTQRRWGVCLISLCMC